MSVQCLSEIIFANNESFHALTYRQVVWQVTALEEGPALR